MLGNIMGVAFGPSTGISEDLGWRLMLGSTVVLPLIVCAQVYFCPESPRYVPTDGFVKIDNAANVATQMVYPTRQSR